METMINWRKITKKLHTATLPDGRRLKMKTSGGETVIFVDDQEAGGASSEAMARQLAENLFTANMPAKDAAAAVQP
jgi:hypothetical protein